MLDHISEQAEQLVMAHPEIVDNVLFFGGILAIAGVTVFALQKLGVLKSRNAT